MGPFLIADVEGELEDDASDNVDGYKTGDRIFATTI